MSDRIAELEARLASGTGGGCRYEYEHVETGEVRTIVQRMTAKHPEYIAFRRDGSWYETFPGDAIAADSDGAGMYRRVLGNNQGNVVNGYPFASNSLPPGNYGKLAESAPDGSPIIKSKAHAREVAAATGKVYRSE